MVSIADAPEVVYTNNQTIDRLFSYLNEGDVKEIVERSLDSDTTGKGGGLSKILRLKYDKSSTDEEETELIRKFDSIGKFAVLHGSLQSEDDISHLRRLAGTIDAILKRGISSKLKVKSVHHQSTTYRR